MRQVWIRPVTLAVAPGTATTPGHSGQLALWLGGFHVRAYPGQAAFPPPGVLPHFLWCCGRGRGLPGPWLPWNCPGEFGRGKPLPYAQQRKKCAIFMGFLCQALQELRCQASDRWEQRLTGVRPWG